VTPLPSSAERERRLRAAPFGLLLLAWGLGVGPLAHAVLAHGSPLVHERGDQGWVQHAVAERERVPREGPPAHHHAPGALEHLQLAVSSVALTLTVAAVVVVVAASQPVAWQSPALLRWRLPEVPGAP
jgi:hypothetical protein